MVWAFYSRFCYMSFADTVNVFVIWVLVKCCLIVYYTTSCYLYIANHQIIIVFKFLFCFSITDEIKFKAKNAPSSLAVFIVKFPPPLKNMKKILTVICNFFKLQNLWFSLRCVYCHTCMLLTLGLLQVTRFLSWWMWLDEFLNMLLHPWYWCLECPLSTIKRFDFDTTFIVEKQIVISLTYKNHPCLIKIVLDFFCIFFLVVVLTLMHLLYHYYYLYVLYI